MSSRQLTLMDRADQWLGAGNVAKMKPIKLGQGRLGFVGSKGKRLWIYQENVPGGQPQTVVLNLTDKMRSELIDALEGF